MPDYVQRLITYYVRMQQLLKEKEIELEKMEKAVFKGILEDNRAQTSCS